MLEIPVSSRCKEILEKRGHVLIGISPFNSYFSEENIKELIHWGNTNFKDFHLLIPDFLPYFNFLAVGYKDSKALSKTKKQNKYLTNKVNRAFSSLGMDEAGNKKIIFISEFSENPSYKDIYNLCLEKYTNDVTFRQKCHDASKVVLKSYTSNVTTEMLDMASKYLLGELPFYLNTAKIIGVGSSLFIYHENIDFFADIYKNREQGFVSNEQGHLILKLVKDDSNGQKTSI